MFKVGQGVIAKENNDVPEGTPGVIIEVDEATTVIPYYVLFERDFDDVPIKAWMYPEEIVADGEVIE